MRGLKDNWIGFLAVLVIISIMGAYTIRSLNNKADISYVNEQIQFILKTVANPLKDISFKLDTIINQNKNDRKGN